MSKIIHQSDLRSSEEPTIDNATEPNPISLTVTIKSAINLRDKVSSLIRVQFGNYEAAESSVFQDLQSPDYNFIYKLDLVPEEDLIDAIYNCTVLITLFEVLPKDKRAILGTSELSLAPFLLSKECEDKDNYSSHNTTGSVTVPIEYQNPKITPQDDKQIKSELIVTVASSRPVVPWDELKSAIVVEFQPPRLFPVPDEWNVKESNEKDINSNLYNYTLGVILPFDCDIDRTIQITSGALVTSSGSDGSQTKIVRWSKGYKTLLRRSAIKKLRERILSKTPLEIGFFRTLQPKFCNCSDNLASMYRGLTSVDIGSLLLPGTSSFTGKFSVINSEYDKEGHSNSATKVRITPYSLINTQISFSISIDQPLLNCEPLSLPNINIQDIIPFRPLPPQEIYSKRVRVAQEEYRMAVRSILYKLDHEFQQHPNVCDTSIPNSHGINSSNESKEIVSLEQPGRHETTDNPGINFLDHVSKSGIYNEIHHQLKSVIVKLIRDTYRHFIDPTKRSGLMSQIYSDLIIITNEELAQHQKTHTVNKRSDTSREQEYLRLSEQCETSCDYPGALHWMTERTMLDPDNLHMQFDLAACAARGEDMDRARTHCGIILSRDPSFGLGLLGMGILGTESCSSKDHTLARTCLLSEKTNISKPMRIALLAAHCSVLGEIDLADTYLAQAGELIGNDGEMYLDAADQCYHLGCVTMAEKLLGYDLVWRKGLGPVRATLLHAKIHILKQQYDLAERQIGSDLERHRDNPTIWTNLGHVYFLAGKFSQAKSTYESMVKLYPDHDDNLALGRLGEIYFVHALEDSWDWRSLVTDEGAMKQAQFWFIRANMWSNIALTCLSMGNIDEAEASLVYAINLNSYDAHAWAVMTLLHLHLGRICEAEQCGSYVLSLGLRHAALLRTCAVQLKNAGITRAALTFAQRASEINEDDRTRALMADCQVRLLNKEMGL